MALAGALCCVLHALTGFTNKSLRSLVAEHLGHHYSQGQMSYDHPAACACTGSSNAYPAATPTNSPATASAFAVLYTKLQNRLLRPLLDANRPPAPIEIRRALTTLEHAVAEYIHAARLAPAK